MMLTYISDERKSTLDNYDDHVRLLDLKAREFDNTFWHCYRTSHARWKFFCREGVKHLGLFKPLKDRYDFIDDALGATIFPCLVAITAALFLVGAIWEGMQILAIKAGWVKDKHQNPHNIALGYLIGAGGLILFAVAKAFQSMLNLLTKPLITVVKGFDTHYDMKRFCIDPIDLEDLNVPDCNNPSF